MGYSISVALPDRESRDRMLAFLNTQDWDALRQASGPEGGHLRDVVEGQDLAYAPKVSPERVLGFNGSMIPHAAWAVVAWVATQYRQNGKDPVFYYDNDRMTCTVADDPNHPSRHFLVDERGVFVIRPPKGPLLLRAAQKMLGSAAHEREEQAWIRNLDQAWAQQSAPAPTAPSLRGVKP